MAFFSIRLLAAILAGFALTCVGSGRTAKCAIMTPGQTITKNTASDRGGSSQELSGKKLDRTDGIIIYAPADVDPGLSIPLFLAPILWRDAAEALGRIGAEPPEPESSTAGVAG